MSSPKTQSQPTQKPSRTSSQTSGTPNKQEIDAAIHQLAQFIQKDPQKAAKIFEGWLDSKGQTKKNVQKKSAA